MKSRVVVDDQTARIDIGPFEMRVNNRESLNPGFTATTYLEFRPISVKKATVTLPAIGPHSPADAQKRIAAYSAATRLAADMNLYFADLARMGLDPTRDQIKEMIRRYLDNTMIKEINQ